MISSDDISELFQFLHRHNELILPILRNPEIDTKLKRMIQAALVAYKEGSTSVDKVLNSRGKYWEYDIKETEENILARKMIKYCIHEVKKLIDKRSKLKNLPNTFGLVAAGVSLLRCQTSFEIIRELINNYHFFEATCILKMIVEQIAWSYKVHTIYDDKVYEIKPTKAITYLAKKIHNIGLLYSILNTNAHIDTSIINELAELTQKKEIAVKLEYPEKTVLAAILLFKTVDTYGIVMELIYKTYFDSLEYINSNGEIIAEREMIKMYRVFLAEWDAINNAT